jgi:hypothetical protein
MVINVGDWLLQGEKYASVCFGIMLKKYDRIP